MSWIWDPQLNAYRTPFDQNLKGYYVYSEGQAEFRDGNDDRSVPAYSTGPVGNTTVRQSLWNVGSLTHALISSTAQHTYPLAIGYGRHVQAMKEREDEEEKEDEEDEQDEDGGGVLGEVIIQQPSPSYHHYTTVPTTSSPYWGLDLFGTRFRLLRLLGQGRSVGPHVPIHCELHCFDIFSAPAYVALSYTWGKKHPSTTITLRGAQFEVGPNLANFLHNRRSSRFHEHEYIWIDAICLNQTNAAELNHQVPLMSHIYRGATEVILWLGENNEPQNIRTMQKAVRSMNLANHPYWSRLWIVQEVMFAVNLVVRFGSLREDWSTFTTMIKAIGGKTSPALKVIKHKDQFYDGNPEFHQKFSLYSLMSGFRHSQARLIHDKVYALNGLATQETRVQVDYTVSELCLAIRVLETITSKTNSGIRAAPMDRMKAIAFFIRALELNQRDASRLKKFDTER